MFSIDQNCTPLWDVVPKLQALAAHGHQVTHFVEDVDVAFTALGSSVDDEVLHLARERFHRSGGQDWGAAMFYAELLGRLPVEIRDWEPLTGLKTKTLARQLGRSVDDLYDEFSPGDTWQLIGSSYIGDRDHHRVIGDLSVRETRDFLGELMGRAKAHMLAAFPKAASRGRLGEWFRAEDARVARLLGECAHNRLVDLYRRWLREYIPPDAACIDLSSALFATGADPARTALLEAFVADYPRASALYNQAIEETASPLRALRGADGELPFFAILEHQGHRVRTTTFLRGEELVLGHQSIPLAPGHKLPVDALIEAGVRCLVGKALLLVVQARVGPAGQPLALPHRGSLYMPAANRLAEKLAANALLPGPLQPIVRVRFRLLDRLKTLDTLVRLPAHLEPSFGRSEVPARELGERWADLSAEAAQRLDAFRDPARRAQWQKDNLGELTAAIAEQDERRRQLAQADTTPEQMSDLWQRTKALQLQLLDRTVRQIANDCQLRDIDYWDSRGALLPWCIALGGQPFYDHVVADAEVYHEPLPEGLRSP